MDRRSISGLSEGSIVTARPIFSLMFVTRGLLLLTCPQQVPYVRPALGFVPLIEPMVDSFILLNPDMFDECAYPPVRYSHVLPLLATAIDLD
jgi:hypothetical protein